jgi:predicted  nucleic acid-binding Zn-ribbon protein
MKELIQRLRKRAELERAAADAWGGCVVRARYRTVGGEAERAAHHANLALDLEAAADALAYAEKRLSDLQGAYADANAEIERLRRKVAQANKDRAQAIGMANEAQAANLRNVRDAAFREQRLRAALEQYEIARSQRGGRDER